MDGKQKLGKKNYNTHRNKLPHTPPHRRLTAASSTASAASPPPHTPARTAASRRPFTTLPVHGAKGGGKLRTVGTKWGGFWAGKIIWKFLTGCDRSVTIRFREF